MTVRVPTQGIFTPSVGPNLGIKVQYVHYTFYKIMFIQHFSVVRIFYLIYNPKTNYGILNMWQNQAIIKKYAEYCVVDGV